MRNQFGNTDAVNVKPDKDGGDRLLESERGDSVDERLSYVHFDGTPHDKSRYPSPIIGFRTERSPLHVPQNCAPDYRIPLVDFLNAAVRGVAETTAWLNVALIGVILAQVVLRYGLHHGLVPLEELMWHLYAVVFMFGLSYAVANDSHIRVDLVHLGLSRRARHLIEILGILLLLMPFLWIVLDHSLTWVADSYRMDESSPSPQGLPYRWLIKSVIPFAFALMLLAALARLIGETLLLFHHGKEPPQELPTRISLLHRLFRVQGTRNRKD